MKRLFILLFSVFSLASLAQTTPEPLSIAPAVGNFLVWMGQRVNSLEVGSQVQEMKINGLTQQEFVAVFSAEGSLINTLDLNSLDAGLEDINDKNNGLSRGSGLHIVPYKITVTEDGRKMVTTSLVKWKNMNSTKEAYWSDGTPTGWSVINDLELIAFEWDEGVQNINTNTFKFDLVRLEAKLDILGAAKPGHILAIVAGGSVGWQKQRVTMPDGSELFLGREKVKDLDLYFARNIDVYGGSVGAAPSNPLKERASFGTCYNVGLEYNLPFNDRNFLNLQVALEGELYGGRQYNKDELAAINAKNEAIRLENEQIVANRKNEIDQYYADRQAWLDANGFESISKESYYNITGIKRPSNIVGLKTYKDYKAPAKTRRSLMYISPKLTFNTALGKTEKGKRLEINLYGNIPISHTANLDGVEIDLTNTNARPILGAGLKLHF